METCQDCGCECCQHWQRQELDGRMLCPDCREQQLRNEHRWCIECGEIPASLYSETNPGRVPICKLCSALGCVGETGRRLGERLLGERGKDHDAQEIIAIIESAVADLEKEAYLLLQAVTV